MQLSSVHVPSQLGIVLLVGAELRVASRDCRSGPDSFLRNMFSWPRQSTRKLAHRIADGCEIVVRDGACRNCIKRY